jgi:hypothetical protein
MKSRESEEGKFDFILVPGDLGAHGVPLDPTDPSLGNYTLLKETIQTVASTFAAYFPDTVVIPTIGNNDPKFHYRGLDLADRDEYYSFYLDSWFS